MSLRVIEVILPSTHLVELASVGESDGVVGVWTQLLSDDLALGRVLVSAKHTESVTDLLSKRFGYDPAFRLILYSVEATLPRFEEQAPTIPDDAAAGAAPGETPGEKPAERVSREELYEDVGAGARLSRIFLVTVVLSTVVAIVGLVRDSVAIIIGAMVIAPLLGPNVALALAATLGDVALGVRALKTGLAGLGVALAVSFVAGWILPFDAASGEIALRTRVGLGDVVLALASGSAGALAFTTGIPTPLVGVMVAVALLPPTATAGLLLGAGHTSLGLGAFLLMSTNVACLNVAGVVTFLAQRVRPRTWWEEDKARKATRVAIGVWAFVLAVLVALMSFLWRE